MRFVFALLFFPTIVFCCPLIGGLPDFNCDQKMNVVVIGDSFVYGIGDTANKNKGGYILRTQEKLPDITITGLGVQGLRTPQLIATLKKVFKSEDTPSVTRDAILGADYIVLDLGRNDRWYFGLPETTADNLKAIRAFIKKKVKAAGKPTPLIITSVLMLPNRGSQGPWVKALNALIKKSDSDASPADLRFDLVSKRLISFDQIHPTSKGYQAITRVFVNYLTKKLPDKAIALKPDEDDDGVFDEFETSKYGTDSMKNDTDGDGKSDGQEIFTLFTNPLDPAS